MGGFQGQEHALLDVGIQGRFTDRRVELDSFDLDFAQDGGRGIAVFDDPAFDVRGQAVDWASEPSGSDISVSEDLILKSMKEAAFRDGRRRGLSDNQIEEAWRKTFGK